MLSKSEIECYFRCPKEHEYRYVDGYEPNEPPSPEQLFGTAFHSILEAHHSGESPQWGKWPAELKHKKETARSMLEVYGMLYSGDAVFTSVERPFSSAVLGVHGFFDGTVNTSNTVTIWEHKTTNLNLAEADWYFQKVNYDWQVGIYLLAARELYPGAKIEMVYNVIRVPALRPRASEKPEAFNARVKETIAASPEAYFGRALVSWDEARLDRLKVDLEAADKLTKSKLPRPMSRNCYQFRKPCGFMPVCFSGESLKNEKLYRIKQSRGV